MRTFIPLGLIIVTALAACGRRAETVVSPQRDWFVDRAKESGLDFVHVNGMSGKLYMPEILAPGVALFDYDNDGDLDVYLVQGETLGAAEPRIPSPDVPASSGGGSAVSQRSDRWARRRRALRFTDVTAQSGIVRPGYGMGVAAGDFDNDGWVDLYLTKFDAPNQLFRNNGDGTFSDVSKSSGTDHRSWSVSASFVDVNRDGWLDLYVGNYMRYTLESNTPCFGVSGAVDYCTPDSLSAAAGPPVPQPAATARSPMSAGTSGIAREYGPALGVSTADFNGDGWMDIYVANDGKENQLWLNQRDGTFENTALLSGVALPRDGQGRGQHGRRRWRLRR